MAWDLYREMWGSHGEFVVDGNLASVEYADRLPSITVPTLITVGDHDQVAPSISEEMHALIKGSTLSVIPGVGPHDVRRSAGAVREGRQRLPGRTERRRDEAA